MLHDTLGYTWTSTPLLPPHCFVEQHIVLGDTDRLAELVRDEVAALDVAVDRALVPLPALGQLPHGVELLRA